MIGYAKYFDSNKTMSFYFKVSDKKLFKKYTKILGKRAVSFVKNLIVSLFIVIMINK